MCNTCIKKRFEARGTEYIGNPLRLYQIFVESMPRYRPETEKLKAENLLKPLIANKLNQSKTARQLGVSQATINEQFNRKPVQDALQKFLNSPKLKNRLIKVAEEGLAANKVISCNVIANDGEGMKDANSMTKDFVDVPDHQSRHKFWHDLMVGAGGIKTGDGASGISVTAVIYNFKTESIASPKEKEILDANKG